MKRFEDCDKCDIFTDDAPWIVGVVIPAGLLAMFIVTAIYVLIFG